MQPKIVFIAVCLPLLASGTYAKPKAQNNDSRYDQYGQYNQRDNGDQYRRDAFRTFTDHDRDVLQDWYRDHSDQFEMRDNGDRHAEDIDSHLQIGQPLDDETRRWAHLVPYNLEQRLDPLPSGWNYLIVGDNVVIVDRDSTVRDVYHFDRFNDHDRHVIQQWNSDHPNALNQFLGAFGVQVNDRDLDQRLQVGNVVDPDLQNRARPAPDDLVNQLSVPPRGWRYVIIGDRLCLVDRDWRIHESFHFQH
jgi:hypothetical protein